MTILIVLNMSKNNQTIIITSFFSLYKTKTKAPTEVDAFGIINDIHCKAVEELMFLLVSQLYITNI